MSRWVWEMTCTRAYSERPMGITWRKGSGSEAAMRGDLRSRSVADVTPSDVRRRSLMLKVLCTCSGVSSKRTRMTAAQCTPLHCGEKSLWCITTDDDWATFPTHRGAHHNHATDAAAPAGLTGLPFRSADLHCTHGKFAA